MTSGSADPRIPEMVRTKLHTMVRHSSGARFLQEASARSARGWLDIMGEAAQAEEPDRARTALAAGLHAPGSDDPAVRVAFHWRHAAVALMLDDDEPTARQALRTRAEILRAHGQPRQADLEDQLSTLLISAPDSFSATVLEGVIDTERDHLAAHRTETDTALPELLTALAFRRFDDQQPDAAVDLLTEALTVSEARESAGLIVSVGLHSSLRMFLAQVHLAAGNTETCDGYAQAVLDGGCNRATRAELWLIRALAAQQLENPVDAATYSLRALELFAGLGIRARAASAAAVIAAQAQNTRDHSTAVLALRVAVDQAEQGEVADSAHLAFALGHELMLDGQFKEAEEVLTGLSRRAEIAGDTLSRAQVLVDLGHAIRQQSGERKVHRAIELWQQAVELMLSADARREAAQIALATGALLSTVDRPAEAEQHMQQAVDLGRERSAPSLALAQALNGLGHLRCEQGNRAGIDDLHEAMDIAAAAGADWRHADYTDTLARGLWALKEPTEAVATALTAADRYRAAGDPATAHQSDLFASFVLLETKQGLEASAVLHSVLDGPESDSLDDTVKLAALTGLADAHTLLGEHGKAGYYQAEADKISQAHDPNQSVPEQRGDLDGQR